MHKARILLLALLLLGCSTGYSVPPLTPLAAGQQPIATTTLKAGQAFKTDQVLAAGKLNVVYFTADW